MFLAWREIRRAKGRFLLLAGSVGLLVYVLLFFQAISGALISSLTGAIENSSADVLVFDERARFDISASIIPDEALEATRAVAGVADVAAVGQAIFSAEAGGEDAEAVVFGIDPDGPGVPTTLSDGRMPDAVGEVVASAQDEPGFAVGDVVRLEPGGLELTVVGVADRAQLNVLPTLYGTFETYAEAVRSRAPGVEDVPASILAVATAEDADAEVVAAAVEEQVDRVQARDREATVAALPATGQIGQSFGILNGLLFVVVTIVTGVFFLILTVQKRDALVLLGAVGARRRDLVGPVLAQVVIVVGGGLLVGTVLATGTLAALSSLLGATLAPSTVATTAAAVLGLGMVAAFGAIRRILAIEPVEATMGGR